jgi:hypothetical protein
MMSVSKPFLAITAMASAIALTAVADNAHADSWHAGLNLRADSGAHPIRVTGGYQFCNTVDASLTLDPMFFTDGQHDIDALAHIWPKRYSLLLGWRTSIIGVAGGNQFQQKAVVGVGAPLPSVLGLRTRWSFELATVVARHGAGLPTKTISFAAGRDFIDLLNFGMFVTVEFDHAR